MVLSARMSFSCAVSEPDFFQQKFAKVPTMAVVLKRSSSSLILSNKLSSCYIIPSKLVHCPKNNLFSAASRNSNSIKAAADKVGEGLEDKSDTSMEKKMSMIDLAVRFIRPYIFFGTTFSYLSTTTRVFVENPHLVSSSSWSLPLRALIVLSVLLGIDGYIGPMNQISDVEIDRINKPYLPLVTGEISLRQAWTFVLSSAMHSIATAFIMDSKALFPLVLLNLFFGTIYSVRPFYTKRSTFGAIFTCASMRGYAFALLHCAAATTTLGLPFRLSPSVIFLTIFSTLVAMCIGVMKDLPDLEGDKKCNVRTLATIIGAEKVACLGFSFLFLAYAGPAVAALLLPGTFKASVMVPAHLLVGSFVAFQAWKLAKANYSKEASTKFYQSLWKLFNVEYLIFPFI